MYFNKPVLCYQTNLIFKLPVNARKYMQWDILALINLLQTCVKLDHVGELL